MKAYRAPRLAGPQALSLVEADIPEPGPGEVRIAVEAAGLHLADLAALGGERQPRPELPFTPGIEVAGRIVAGGLVGSRVVAFTPWGGLAEQVVVPAAACALLPETIAASQAAALPFAYAGALLALDDRAGLAAGRTAVVLGAGSETGLGAVAVARALGATVIAVANGESRLDQAREQGADHALDSGLVTIATAVGELTEGRGADLVFDPVGGDGSQAGLNALARGGTLVLAGFASGRPPALDLFQLFARGGRLLTLNVVLEITRDPEGLRRALSRVVEWTAEGRIAPRIAAEFPFEGVRHAFEYIAGRRGAGAVVVKSSAPS